VIQSTRFSLHLTSLRFSERSKNGQKATEERQWPRRHLGHLVNPVGDVSEDLAGRGQLGNIKRVPEAAPVGGVRAVSRYVRRCARNALEKFHGNHYLRLTRRHCPIVACRTRGEEPEEGWEEPEEGTEEREKMEEPREGATEGDRGAGLCHDISECVQITSRVAFKEIDIFNLQSNRGLSGPKQGVGRGGVGCIGGACPVGHRAEPVP
jgi:hypothetical protein